MFNLYVKAFMAQKGISNFSSDAPDTSLRGIMDLQRKTNI
jgi:hypothetical protein